MSPDPTLLIRAGPLAGQRLEVSSELVLGRESPDVALDDEQISRSHARLRRIDNRLQIEDLGSLNGTFVNGERIRTPVALAPGDRVRLGRTELEVERLAPRRSDEPKAVHNDVSARRLPATHRTSPTLVTAAQSSYDPAPRRHTVPGIANGRRCRRRASTGHRTVCRHRRLNDTR